MTKAIKYSTITVLCDTYKIFTGGRFILKNEKETKEKLLSCAKKEFLEKGYNKASLRNICSDAGVTTGALYFFFKDKEDLFAMLVKKPIDDLYNLMMMHYQDEMALVQNYEIQNYDYLKDIEASNQIIHYMYQNYDEFQLILTKSQGSRFENTVDKFIKITEKHYKIIIDKMAQENNIPKVDDYIIHWMAHMHMNVFVHLITHESSEKEALNHINSIMKYLVGGWREMFFKKAML